MADWPNWQGQTAVIVGTGPSATESPLLPARDKARFFVVKVSWRLAPWADAMYGIDKDWWIANHGVPDFKGLKFSPSPTAARAFGLRQVKLKARAEILTGETGILGCGLKTGGGHSGHQAVNLAVQFGAKRILLVGFDMTLANGAHWSNETLAVAKPDAARTNSWREAFDSCAPQFKTLGVEVINCASKSALKNYPKMPLHEALW